MAGLNKFWKKKTLLLKAETTAGVDSNPTGALNAVRASDVSITLEGQEISAPVDSDFYQNDDVAWTNRTYTFSGKILMYPSGAAGTPPNYASLLLASNHAEVTVAATSVTYTPVSGSSNTATIYLDIDGVLYKAVASKGTVGFTNSIGSFTEMNFEFKGTYLQPVDGTVAPVTLPSGTPLVNSKDNSELSVHGLLVDGIEFNLDTNQTNETRESTETFAVANLDRKANASMVCWADAIATFNPFAINEAGTQDVIYWQNGTAAGQIIRFELPKAQLGLPQPQDVDGVSGYGIDIIPKPNTGDDEYKIIFM